jgi:branched-chain amino acid transport system permease protein
MTEFWYDLEPFLQQGTLGLVNGAFYALLSLGLAVIFGMLNVINFAHGAQFMLGAVVAWMLLTYAGIGYWGALVLSPLIVGLLGVAIERTMIARLYKLDHLYGLLLTFGLALLIEGLVRNQYGVSGLPYGVPDAFRMPPVDLGYMLMPAYRFWIVVVSIAVCLGTWYAIEKTKLGSYLRAAVERPQLVQAFGINVPLMMTATYGAGVALAAFAGVLAAPVYSVHPGMGANFIIIVFAVVVIGGMGSIMGSVVSGYALGMIEGFTRVYYPEASATVVFVIMAIVLLVRPAGLFGRA